MRGVGLEFSLGFCFVGALVQGGNGVDGGSSWISLPHPWHLISCSVGLGSRDSSSFRD
ncbi:hypothetical protein E2562_036113, partial [Oryza meyeriana var. granulata]